MSKSDDGEIYTVIGFLILIVLAAVVRIPYQLATGEDVQFELTEVERVGGDSGKYLVFAVDETFKNQDVWVRGKFGASDLHGQLKKDAREGRTSCEGVVYGWRIPIVSSYRNLVEAKCT